MENDYKVIKGLKITRTPFRISIDDLSILPVFRGEVAHCQLTPLFT